MDRLVALLGMLGLVSFATALLCGPLVTVFPPYAEASWWLWPALRVLWVFASAAVMSVGLAWEAPGGFLRRLAIVGAVSGGLGALLSLNPLLDLVRGPYIAQGSVTGADIGRGTLLVRPTAPTPTIDGELSWQGSDGSSVTIQPMGIQANRLEDALAACPGGQGRLVVLRHLDVFVALDCGGTGRRR